jgi:ribonuclease HI
MVKNLREKFEKKGGVIQYISGDINPADLGFHR